jgi:hypothetical protein
MDREDPSERDDDEKPDVPETPPDEPRPSPVQDPPPGPGTPGPYVVSEKCSFSTEG